MMEANAILRQFKKHYPLWDSKVDEWDFDPPAKQG